MKNFCSTKTAEKIDFELLTHVTNKLRHKTVPAFFLKSYSFLLQYLDEIRKSILKANHQWEIIKKTRRKRVYPLGCVLVCYEKSIF